MKNKLKEIIKKIPGLNWLGRTLSDFLLRHKTIEDRFTSIFLKNGWGDTDSLSGTGSNLAETAAVRQGLEALLKEFNIKSLLDIPCGDFFWMKEVNLGELDYIGADIVKPLIEKNSSLYGQPKRKFCQLDLINSTLPQADLVLCRDCLVHLSNDDVRQALRNIVKSGSIYLLTTTFSKHEANKDIITGRWRPLNLERAPFNLPKPLFIVDEHCQEGEEFKDKVLALWRVSDLV